VLCRLCCAAVLTSCAGKLAAQGQQLEFIWDEGGTIYRDGLPPLTHLPVALVATAEKLYQVGGVLRGSRLCLTFRWMLCWRPCKQTVGCRRVNGCYAGGCLHAEGASGCACSRCVLAHSRTLCLLGTPTHSLLLLLLQEVAVTIHASGGHSSMPPIDGSSIGTRLGSFLSALSASPPTPRLVSPTRELVEGLVTLAGPWLALLLRLVKVRRLLCRLTKQLHATSRCAVC
jgi:hypothetical protein